MKRAAVTALATIVGLVVLLSFKSHGSSAHLLRPGAFAPATPGPVSSPSAAPSRTSGSAAPSGGSTTVVGQAVDTQYGPVQVQVTVSNGRITSVTPVQLPQDRQRDIEIDNYAVPQLIQETLQAQSAQIDAVSGATFTSEGYAQSLQSALDQLHR